MGKYITIELTKFQALFIKLLRERYECTWRAVAGHFEERYDLKTGKRVEGMVDHSNMTCGGNQLEGMFLCKEAATLLNENWE